MAAKISKSKDKLIIRLYHPSFPNGESWEGTSLKDTPENNRQVKAITDKINAEMKAGKFDYLRWFPEGNKAKLFKAQKEKATPKTIRQYFEQWKVDKVPPFIRKSLAEHYESHFRCHILPIHGDRLIQGYGMADLREIRTRLVSECHLSMQTVKNVLNASLRAFFRDAKGEGVIERSPFDDLPPRFWPKTVLQPPDPFTENERDEIVAYFDKKYRQTWARGCAFMFSLFWTGARPSELVGRKFSDYDPRTGNLSITTSRSRGEEGTTKTSGSTRTIPLLVPVKSRLEDIRPLRTGPEDFIFTHITGGVIDQDFFAREFFQPALTVLKIRHRRFYNTRATFISVMLTHGENAKQIAEYCGTSLAMIEKHYGRYMGGHGTFGDAALAAKPKKKSEVQNG